MKLFFLLIVFCFSFLETFVGFAQVSNTQKIFGGNSFDFGNDLVQTSDSGYLMLGSSGSYSTSSDVILWNLDKDLNYRWHRIFGLNDADNAIKLCTIGIDSFFVLNSTLHPGSGNYDIWTFELLPNGDTIHSKVFDHGNWEFPSCVIKIQGGGFLIGGFTFQTSDSNADIFLLKLDENYNEEWYNKIEKPGDDSISALVEFNNRFYGIGTSQSLSGGQADISFMKFDEFGTLIMDTFFGGGNDDQGADIVVAPDGNLILGGQSKSFGSFPNFFNTYLMKVDTNAAYIWPQQQTSDEQLNYEMKKILLDGSGNIFSFLNKNVSSQSDFQVYKNNPGGYFLSSAVYGTYGNEFIGNAILTNDGGVAVYGTTSDFTYGLENFYLVKADSNLSNTLSPFIEVGMGNEKINKPSFVIFPSLANEQVSMIFGPEFFEGTIQVFSSFGYCVFSNSIVEQQLTLERVLNMDVSNFSSGVYIVRICNVRTGKESLQKFVVLDR